jgi:N-glycosidase YbiA
MSTIHFYHEAEPYGAFSNFAAYPIELDGKTWPTSEHYFQAAKFVGTEHEAEILKARTAALAARMGRDRARPIRADWEEAKDGVMLAAVRAKFTQHEPLRALLLGTGDATLVEHTYKDNYWGDGGDGSGKNMLGKMLMQVRDELRGGAPSKR